VALKDVGEFADRKGRRSGHGLIWDDNHALATNQRGIIGLKSTAP
jgi:hypothetical protein